MRRITTHHTNEANRGLLLEADDRNPDNGNASHEYRINYYEKSRAGDYSVPSLQTLSFQNGPIKEVGINGITNEVLLAIVIDRLEGFQTSKWACPENESALECARTALMHLESRPKAREARGVERHEQRMSNKHWYESQSTELDRAYYERNALVAALSKLYPSHLAEHPDDSDWDPAWKFLVIIQLPTGQVSWHMHLSHLGEFAHLEFADNNWDGHTTPEKYERLAAL